MYDQRLIFTVEGPEGRLDEIVFDSKDGPIIGNLSPTSAGGTNGLPSRSVGQVPLSQLLAVRLDDGELGEFDPAAFVRAIPSHRRGAVVRYIAGAIKAKEERRRHTAVYLENDQPKETNDV